MRCHCGLGRWMAGASLFVMACSGGAGEAGGRREGRPKPVRVVSVESASLRETTRAVGTIEAERSVGLKAERTDRVRAVEFEDGDLVDAGAALFRLEDREARRRVSAARAALARARADAEEADRFLTRQAALLEDQVIAPADFDEAKRRAEAARAEVDRARAELGAASEEAADSVVRAPFAGRVGRSQVDPGAVVGPQDTLVELFSRDLQLVFYLPVESRRRVAVGDEVLVHLPNTTLPATISFIAPSVSPSTRTFLLEAELSEGRALPPGRFVDVEVRLDSGGAAPVVPEEAVVGTEGQYRVFVIEDGRARARPVRLGARVPGRVTLLEGAEVGEDVVVEGQMRLTDGTPVRVLTSTAPGEGPS